MNKAVKIYKPSDKEILQNVLQSFEIENIHISPVKAGKIFSRMLANLKKIKKENV